MKHRSRARTCAARGVGALMAGLCLALTGCVNTGAASPIAHPASAEAPAQPAELDGPYIVTRVIDGDTIWIDRRGTLEKIRLIGADTPELYDPRKPVQCYGQEASDFTKAILGQEVYLETDPSQDSIDKYGRTLAYVWTDTGTLINFELIAGGYAHEYTYDTPYRYQGAFRAAERTAQDGNVGLWSPANCATG